MFRYRFDPCFKKRVVNGKAFICSKHFRPVDIIQTNCKSNLKFGCLPTVNLPIKSHQTVDPPERRKITKYTITEKKKMHKLLTLRDITQEWDCCQIQGWRIHHVSKSKVHLTYYKNDLMHFSPTISLLIAEKDSELQFSIAYNGLYAPNFSESLGFADMSLKEFLQYLEGVKVCPGYDFVPDATGWECRKVSYVQEDKILYRRR